MTEKILKIEQRLSDVGYQFFNKQDSEAKYSYYHNQKNPIIDIKFEYLSDEWELIYTTPPKIEVENGDLVSSSEICRAVTFSTDTMYNLFVSTKIDLLDMAQFANN